MGLRNALTRIRDTRSGATTHPLGDIHAADAFVAESFGPEPEDTDPGGADLTDPAAIPPGAHRSTQTKYGADVRRCQVPGCGTHTTGLVCSVCLAAGRLPAGVDVYVAPYTERILPDPPLGYQRSSFLTEAILDGEEDLPTLSEATHHLLNRAGIPTDEYDLPTLDECGPNATATVVYPGGDAA